MATDDNVRRGLAEAYTDDDIKAKSEDIFQHVFCVLAII